MEASGRGVADRADFARIISFTDGVFAIAITLLVLNFDVPELPAGHEFKLDAFLNELWGDFGAYFLTFAVVGRLWIVHHRLFSSLRTFDSRLVVLNLIYLSMIALIPFPAELLGDYGDHPLPAAIYALVLGTAASLNWFMARHAVRAGLVEESSHEEMEPWGSTRALFIPAVFVVSIPVALASPLAAELMWTLLIGGRILAGRRLRRRPD